MWPFERKREQEYLLIGRHALERWSGPATALSLVARQALPEGATLSSTELQSALLLLFPNPPQMKITVLLESAWLPVLLLEVGATLWTPAQVEPLLRHRLHSLYGEPQGMPVDWELRLDYVPGQPFALGYGIPAHLRQSLVAVGQALGLRWAALLPAVGWGFQRLRSAYRARDRMDRSNSTNSTDKSVWWVWPEQDRLLLARMEDQRMVSLHPGLALTDSPASIVRMVAAEAARTGSAVPHAPIRAATWSSGMVAASASDRLEWCSITAPALPCATQFPQSGPSSMGGQTCA